MGSVCFDCGARIDRRSQRCKSCASKLRQRELRKRLPPADGVRIVEWGGQRWYMSKDSYYRNRTRQLLHRQVYMAKHGSIPPGYDVVVHHENHDKADFSIDNLRGVSVSERLIEHGVRGFTAWGPGDERHSKRVLTMWANRKPVARECAVCGNPFESIGMRSKYCGSTCRSRAGKGKRLQSKGC